MEEWSWGKFFDLTPSRFGKDHAIGFRLLIIIVMYSLVGYGAYTLWQNIHGHKQLSSTSTSRVTGDTSISSAGGSVKTMDVQATQSTTSSTTTTVTNIPFANGILGQFGSWFKTQGNNERRDSA